MMERLFDRNPHQFRFTATVTAVEPWKDGFAVTLSRSCFFPEAGGQCGDTGWLGAVRVTDTQERGREILHCVAEPLPVGTVVTGQVDEEPRLRRMQNHSGEHILSGLVHDTYGFENTGFHLGDDGMTIDFSGELTMEELLALETRVNECIRANVPIRAWYPAPEELAAMSYRSKLDLKENVRIVEIEGIDRCACCAPHVSFTGEVGCMKILDAMRHRGGVRVSAVCGMDSLERMNVYQRELSEVSHQLSCKRELAANAVDRLLRQEAQQKERILFLSRAYIASLTNSIPAGNAHILRFEELLDEVAVRELVNALMEKTSGLAAVFFGEEGNYRYVIGSQRIDLRREAKRINTLLSGRGGGQSRMISGTCTQTKKSILEALSSAEF